MPRRRLQKKLGLLAIGSVCTLINDHVGRVRGTYIKTLGINRNRIRIPRFIAELRKLLLTFGSFRPPMEREDKWDCSILVIVGRNVDDIGPKSAI
jgi:hypothetical protein